MSGNWIKEKWEIIAVGALALGLASLGAVIWQLESEIAFLKQKPHDHSVASLEQQKQCAAQARKVYLDAGWSLSGVNKNGAMSGYTNHYNVSLGRCFFIVNSTWAQADTVSLFSDVSDAFEGTEYGSYSEVVPKSGPNRIVMCSLTAPGEPTRFCHSKEEWEHLVGPYIGGD